MLPTGIVTSGVVRDNYSFECHRRAVDFQQPVLDLHAAEAETGTHDLLLFHLLVTQTQHDGVEVGRFCSPGDDIGPRATDVDRHLTLLVEDHPTPHAVEGMVLRVPNLHL